LGLSEGRSEDTVGEHLDPTLERAEALLAGGRRDEALVALRVLSLDDFGRLLLRVPDRFPRLQAALPEMPSDTVQKNWTGDHGERLLRLSCAFVRTTEAAYARLTGRSLETATVLDYGCGWGRLLRLMYRFCPPERIYGLDASEEALEICRATRLLGNLARCDYVPRALPFEGVTFDLVYAFSVFTHLSERTAGAVLAAVRRRIRPDGLFVVTVRPVEYWSVHPRYLWGTTPEQMRAQHAEHGFAFLPHDRAPIDGDITYGDVSISLGYVREHWTEWDLVGNHLDPIDPHQQVLFLRPR
jgi:SAM-dependent methyltransferase